MGPKEQGLDLDVLQWLNAYAEGWFPMANEENELHWYSATHPAVLPMDGTLHIPRSLKKILRKNRFHPTWNHSFGAVLDGCAARAETWINEELKAQYWKLHRAGYAHSFETWENGRLAGGVLGLALGGAFIGETMFTGIEDGGKVALVLLVDALRRGGFVHFDCQLLNDNTQRFGAYEISAEEHKAALASAIALGPRPLPEPSPLILI